MMGSTLSLKKVLPVSVFDATLPYSVYVTFYTYTGVSKKGGPILLSVKLKLNI